MTNTTSHSPSDQLLAEMRQIAERRSTAVLGQTLEFFDQHQPGLGANDLLAREIIIDVLCRRHHEIDAAYQSWKRDADAGIVDKLGDIVAAVIRSLGPATSTDTTTRRYAAPSLNMPWPGSRPAQPRKHCRRK